jgi:hypothetical protein
MVLLAAVLVQVVVSGLVDPQGSEKGKPAFTFGKQGYYHRYSKDNLHEFTPKGQSNLQKWTDMVTVNDYPSTKDGEALAGIANSVLETYKANKAVVVKTNSVPRTASKPAEHLVVVLFPRPEFIEASFTRFVLNKGVGASVVYSHRIYGKKAGDPMSQWLLKNGEKSEKELMAMPVPKH